MPNYIKIGRIVAVTGVDGELIIEHQLGQAMTSGRLVHVYIEQNKNSYIPYFISSARAKNEEEALIKLEDVHTREAAGLLLKKKVHVEKAVFDAIIQEDSTLYYIGFAVKDKREGFIGRVQEVMELPTQKLLRVSDESHEYLIPFMHLVEKEADLENKILVADLPEGLLNIYRS